MDPIQQTLIGLQESVNNERAGLIHALTDPALTQQQRVHVVHLLDLRTHQLMSLNTLVASMDDEGTPPIGAIVPPELLGGMPHRSAVRLETLRTILEGDVFILAKDPHTMEGPNETIVAARAFVKKRSICVCILDINNPNSVGNIFEHRDIGIDTPVCVVSQSFYPETAIVSVTEAGQEVVCIPESEED